MALATREVVSPAEFYYGSVTKRGELLELLYCKADHFGWRVDHSKRFVDYSSLGSDPLRARVYRRRIFTTSSEFLETLRGWGFVESNNTMMTRSVIVRMGS